MDKILIKALVLLICFIKTTICEPNPTDVYVNSLELQPNMYYMFWNYTSTDVLIELQVKTTGWIGFGLSPNGGMDGSDVIVAWLDKTSGKANFTDRHINGRRVLVDQVQNWFPILVTSRDGYVVAKFTRKVKICDKTGEDMDIPDGTPFVIFAYGTSFGADGDIAYHDFRGTKSVQLLSSLNIKVDLDMSQVETMEYRVDVNTIL